jgi:DNA recombination-dependent growth factor C
MDTRAIFQSNRKATQRMCKIIQYLSEKQASQAVGQDWTARGYVCPAGGLTGMLYFK